MPNGYEQHNAPHMAEIIRRVQRVEDKLDARTLTVDVYNAKEAAHQIEIAAITQRIVQLENALNGATKMIIGAFLGLLIQFIVLGIALFGRGAT